MRRVKFQEGGQARSGINNEPVGQNFRRLLERMTAPSARSEAPAQGPRPQSGQRPQEDRARMAAEAAAQYDREEADRAARAAARREARANRQSAITNDPVGSRLAGRAAPPSAAPAREPRMNLDPGDVMEFRTDRTGPAGAARMREIDMQGADMPGNRSMSPPGRPRPRPQPRRNTPSGEDAERERQRIAMGAVLSEMMRGGEEQPRERGFFERMGLRRTNETGLEPGTEARMRDMYGSQYSSQYNMKQGGKVKAYREGGAIRQGMQSPKAQEGRAEMAEDVMRRERAREPISDKERKAGRAEAAMDSGPLTGAEKERMRSSGFKKGGMIKPKAKTAMKKGGVVKKAAGGKVAAPKKMMKGGMTSKPKKMMGGGKAMYAKGGMAKGCK